MMETFPFYFFFYLAGCVWTFLNKIRAKGFDYDFDYDFWTRIVLWLRWFDSWFPLICESKEINCLTVVFGFDVKMFSH